MCTVNARVGEVPITDATAWKAALKEAAGKNKAVLAFFNASWCHNCYYMSDELGYATQKAVEEGFDGRIMNVNVSMERGQSTKPNPGSWLGKAYKIRGFPTLYYLDAETGEVIAEFNNSRNMNGIYDGLMKTKDVAAIRKLGKEQKKESPFPTVNLALEATPKDKAVIVAPAEDGIFTSLTKYCKGFGNLPMWQQFTIGAVCVAPLCYYAFKRFISDPKKTENMCPKCGNTNCVCDSGSCDDCDCGHDHEHNNASEQAQSDPEANATPKSEAARDFDDVESDQPPPQPKGNQSGGYYILISLLVAVVIGALLTGYFVFINKSEASDDLENDKLSKAL